MNKKRRCGHCKIYKEQNKGVVVGLSFFCDKDCMFKKAMKHTEKKQSKPKKQKPFYTRKERFATLSYMAKQSKMQDVFNKLRRYQEFKWFSDRGLEPTCISCGEELRGDQWCNGHYKSVGARKDLRFDTKNSYLQHNVRCNKHLSGDVNGYEAGLVKRFGEKQALEIMEYCKVEQPIVKMCDDEMHGLMDKWRKEIKELKVFLSSN